MVAVRSIVLWACVASLALAGVAAIVFQDNLSRFFLKPTEPYQLYTPPPAPSYGARGAWFAWPDDPSFGRVDIFYIHSTTYGERAQWNAPVGESRSDATLRMIAAPNEIGPFASLGAIYGPRYRQATRYTEFTHKFDGLAARELAFTDIETAFDHFVEIRDPNRPFIIVGYGQGGLHALGLLQLKISKRADLRKALLTAYIIDKGLPSSLFEENEEIAPLCSARDETGCIVNFIALTNRFEDEARRYRRRTLVWDEAGALTPVNRPSLACVNPLIGKQSNEPAAAADHIGAASATGLHRKMRPPAISKAIGAKCDFGILRVDQPRQTFLRQRHWFGAHWRTKDFNLFYFDLEADARRRLNRWHAKSMRPQAQMLDLEELDTDKNGKSEPNNQPKRDDQ